MYIIKYLTITPTRGERYLDSIRSAISLQIAFGTATDFRLTFKRLDDLPTYRYRGPMSTLCAFLGTWKRLDELPTSHH